MIRIVDIGYRSTHYYLLEPQAVGLLVDAGWPGSLPEMTSVLRRKGLSIGNIRYILATHFHPDHAGLVQELRDLGARLIVLTEQIPHISGLEKNVKPDPSHKPIQPVGQIELKREDSRNFLRSIGLEGEIIPTPGHSEDSVTLILDEGLAFTGDLPPVSAATDEQRKTVEASWRKIIERKAKTVYPAHGPTRPVDRCIVD